MSSSWEIDLQKAVDDKDLSLVQTILSRDEVRRNGNLGRKEWKGLVSPLHVAAVYGRNDVVQALVDAGVDIDCHWGGVTTHRMTSLHFAVMSNRGAAVKLLLDLGADPTLMGEWGEGPYALGTPLEWARRNGYTETVRILEEHAAKPPPPNQAPSAPSFETLDSVAKLTQKSDIVKELEEAYKFQSEIADKKEEVTKLSEKILKETQRLETLRKELKTLEEQPSFRRLDELKRHLEEIETIGKTLKDVLEKDKNTCPVCFLFPKQVFTCRECDSWICQDCKARVVACPKCRVDLAEKPLGRNKGMEKMMGIP